MIRKLLGIQTRCEFRRGRHRNTCRRRCATSVADVVDVHRPLPPPAVHSRRGRASARGLPRLSLFLETICLPASVEDDRLRDALELKDLPYFFGPAQFGVTGHKFESGYYDGSALRLSVVSLPFVEALRMFLRGAGLYRDVTVVADPEELFDTRSKAGGGCSSAVCMTATRTRSAPSRPRVGGRLRRRTRPHAPAGGRRARPLSALHAQSGPAVPGPAHRRASSSASLSRRGWRLAWARRRLVADRRARIGTPRKSSRTSVLRRTTKRHWSTASASRRSWRLRRSGTRCCSGLRDA